MIKMIKNTIKKTHLNISITYDYITYYKNIYLSIYIKIWIQGDKKKYY